LFTSNEESGTAFSKRVSLKYKISHVKVKLPPKKAFTLIHMKVSKNSMNVGSNPDNRKKKWIKLGVPHRWIWQSLKISNQELPGAFYISHLFRRSGVTPQDK
jgi:hypothetical protein